MKMRKWFAPLLVLLLLSVMLPGCKKNASTTSSNSGTTVPRTHGQYLGQQKAQSIALEHAGFTSDQVIRLHTQFEWDDNVPVYEVDFRQGDYEYDYTIHAETGEILEVDKDTD